MKGIGISLIGMIVLIAMAPAEASFFDIYTELSIDSVHYPVTGNSYMQMNAKRPGSLGVEEMVRYSFGDEMTAGMQARAVNRDDGSPVVCAPDSFFDIFLESFGSAVDPGSQTYGRFMIDSFFDVFCSAGMGKGKVENAVVAYMAPDSFFDIFVEMSVPTAGGNQTIHIRGELNADQPIAFGAGGVSVTPGLYDIDSFFDIFTEICSTDNSSGPFTGFDLSQPLMTLKMEIVPEPATMALLVIGGPAVLLRRRK